MFRKIFILTLYAAVHAGCESDLLINAANSQAVAIDSLETLMAKPGDSIPIKGRNLKSSVKAEIAGNEVPMTLVSAKEANVTIPDTVSEGLAEIVFKVDEESIAKFPLLLGDSTESVPILPVSISQMCDDFIFKDADGQLVRGERDCSGGLALCDEDGQVDCKANAAYPAVAKDGLAAKVGEGLSAAGVTGTLPQKPDDCSEDGEISCVAVADFPAVDKSSITANAAKIRSSLSVAGVSGSLADCASDGATSCVAVTNFPAANISAAAAKILTGQTLAGVNGSAAISPSDCTADGQTSCVAVTNFPAADKSTAAAKILTGQTLAGVNGSAAIRPADCSSDGQTSCVAVTNFPAVDKANSLTANASKMRDTVTIAGVSGTLADCASSGSQSCYATGTYYAATSCGANGSNCFIPTYNGTGNNYKAIDFTAITAGVIKDGVSIAGVTGDYPSATYPLTGADGTADLTDATFDAKVKSATAFEWFDSAGSRYTGAGDADITAANIADTITIFGTTGNLVGGGSNCTGDGQTGCVTTATYKSVDTSALTAWDIRAGKSAGGISGSLRFYQNMANLATYNRTAGTGTSSSTTVADQYDTVDDWNNNGTFPADAPTGFVGASASNWVRDAASDTDVDGTCNGAEDCVYKDRITDRYWIKDNGTGYTFANAMTYCENLSYGTYTDWRVPTQKELMMAAINGIWSLKAAGALNLAFATYSTSTRRPDKADHVWGLYLGLGHTFDYGVGDSLRVICIR